MNEANITSQLEVYLRSMNKGPVIKHADKATIGVPDLSITGGGKTTWIEVKLVKFQKPKDFDLAKIVNKDGPQYRMMTLLDHHGCSLWVIFFTDSYMWWTMIYNGKSVAEFVRQGYNVNPLGGFTYEGKCFDQVWNQIQEGRKR